jgi:hypothetical protein
LISVQKRRLLPVHPPQIVVALLKVVLILLVGGGVFFLLDRVQRDTVLTLDQTRPVIAVVALLLSAVALWGIVRVLPSLVVHRHEFAWRMAFRVVGWIGIVGSVLGVALLLLSKDSNPKMWPLTGVVRAVEFAVPLVVGIQAAFLFSPDDEPSMEVLLACPRPVSWVLLERLMALAALQTAVALVGTLASIAIAGDADVLLTFVRWITPALFFGGLGVYTTVRSRQPAFGVALVGLLWFVFGFIGVTMLPGMPSFWPLSLMQPFIWSIYGYMRPTDLTTGDYILNRIVLAALGLVLVLMTARQLRDEEHILSGGKLGKSSKGS